ncbi:N-acetylglucosamine-6-phosphate deacetylase [Cryobacterium sp. MLB-32]|uniref:N-acetylglucosamine-6-phosphate deacetylase n=1 Tax=Cryobacterium sp. MLB-32 TaxID=1529318 RepID=UPI000AC5A29E|nr:N-acetylglucosamine-6-phosphate deacetylase [Cryobacterium sp. MLB-32]
MIGRPGRALIHSARLVSGGSLTADSWVLFENGVVGAVGTGSTWRDVGVDAGATTNAAGRHLTPGFIDIHCHGGGGAAFDDGAEAIAAALAVHHRHGTTRAVLSLVTASQADLESRVAVVAAEAERNPLVLGAHLEGPFLDATFRGAHDPALLQSPVPESVERLLAVGRGQIRQVTIAPELPGAADALARFVAAGVRVAVGHSSADYETARAAFDAGASILTHAFNGMNGIHHRAPGPVVAAMDSPGVVLEVINDGVHVHPSVVRLAFAGSPGRIALVTDAMAATGASDGHYLLGSLAVEVIDGVARLVDGGSIAGSTLTLDVALRNAVAAGIDLPDAVTALTETPARAIGRTDLGLLAVGYAADAVLLGPDLTVDAVFAEGRLLSPTS